MFTSLSGSTIPSILLVPMIVNGVVLMPRMKALNLPEKVVTS